ncbi:unnamed protein product [Pleuronectes platessa]|uniref:Uncharacterized protein n=1 Tax=Pleuronectes platessa TaxID=8262 RepID=A0A9N7V6F6_PLEPL|nr:unnamed protein product [Pleuronectes platessa]
MHLKPRLRLRGANQYGRTPLLLLRVAARASQEMLSAERAHKHGFYWGDTNTQELRIGLASESIVSPHRTRNGISPPPPSLMLPGSEPLKWSQQPEDITKRARAEEGAVARNLPRPPALLLGQTSASQPAPRLISATGGGGYAM